LPTFLREYDKLARQCAAEGLDHIRFLLRLAELELIDRERRMVERRIKEARFQAVKSLDSFDFAAIPSLNKTLVLELARSVSTGRGISSLWGVQFSPLGGLAISRFLDQRLRFSAVDHDA
jgi:DNA replication protein DnaC